MIVKRSALNPSLKLVRFAELFRVKEFYVFRVPLFRSIVNRA